MNSQNEWNRKRATAMKIFMTQIFHPLLLMSKINLYREWKTAHKSMRVWGCKSSRHRYIVQCAQREAHKRMRSGKNWKSLKNRHKKWINTKLHKLCLFFPPWKWVSRSQAQPARMQRGYSLYNTERRRLESVQRLPPDELVHRTTFDLVPILSLVAASETRAFPFMHIKNTQADVSMCWAINEWRNMISISTKKELFRLIHLLNSKAATWHENVGEKSIHNIHDPSTYTSRCKKKTLSMHRTHSRVLFS